VRINCSFKKNKKKKMQCTLCTIFICLSLFDLSHGIKKKTIDIEKAFKNLIQSNQHIQKIKSNKKDTCEIKCKNGSNF
jgi:hypothetical protein